MLCDRSCFMRNGRVRDLQLATQARHREAELLTILCHGTSGDGIASGRKELGELLIGERLTRLRREL